MIRRYSSRRRHLAALLPELLEGATAYDRIAGYFRSSILEVAGEALENMAPDAVVRVVCNSELDPLDVLTARAAQQAMTLEWHRALPDDLSPALRDRLCRLGDFLQSGKLRVRVLPDEVFGLVHGKAGVIHRIGQDPVAFIGSTNESRTAWSLNYEIVWTDDSDEGVGWVQEEFDALWNHPQAVPLADAVVQEVVRLVRRVVIPNIDAWKTVTREPDASAAIELPIYRRENGLWAHQKWFVRHAFDLHRCGGARLVLADEVGLGKTVQLALAAKLMTLWGGGKVLGLVPKPLLRQWQRELWTLLQLPSSIWTGQGWEDERGVYHPAPPPEGFARCPRRLGLVSTGLIRRSADARDQLSALRWECVILDEAHHARRQNLGPSRRNEGPQPNRLLSFLWTIASQTKSLLLATATPVQLDPIEAWDLLHALNLSNWTVLGSRYSRWETQPRTGLALVLGQEDPPAEPSEAWEWIRDPLPPSSEDRDLKVIRGSLQLSDATTTAAAMAYDQLGAPDKARLQRFTTSFFKKHHPFIRHIVRRRREYLETTLDPETNEPYLKPVRVRLFGEDAADAILLTGALRDAYEAAEDFCDEVGKRPGMNSGFLKTLLLRRVGSTMHAGRQTAIRMLGARADEEDREDDADDQPQSSLYPFTPSEEEHLERCLRLLEQTGDNDPKYQRLEQILLRGSDGTGPWLQQGCIVFTQYLESAWWVIGRLSARLPGEPIGLYAGGSASGVYRAGVFSPLERDTIKEHIRHGDIRLLVGTDAASEGLNLQRLGTLVNLDLPWNPTRLEQRKGRIQRIGQVRDEVYIYNLRYRDSVEDRVHQLLSARLAAIHDLFGQLPDTLEDVWVAVAERDEQKAREIIDAVPTQHPFEMRYDRVESVDWESCSEVLDAHSQLKTLLNPW